MVEPDERAQQAFSYIRHQASRIMGAVPFLLAGIAAVAAATPVGIR